MNITAHFTKRRIGLAILAGILLLTICAFIGNPAGTVFIWFNILLVFGILTIIVSFHEFSHLLTAKALHIGVEEFGLAFPPTLATKRAFGIDWKLNSLPFGAYVKLKGEQSDDGEASFSSARTWKKVLILVAGPLSNLVLAFVMLAAMGAYYSASQNLNFSLGQDFQFARLVLENVISQTIAGFASFIPVATSHPLSMPVAGIPGMVVVSTQMSAQGWEMVVMFMAILSFSLGIMNLLPIPRLDGGAAVAAIIKGLTGRFYPEKLGRWVTATAFTMLLLFVALVQGINIIQIVTGNFPGLSK